MESQLVTESNPIIPLDGIPRIIHQTWKSSELPGQMSKCRNSVLRMNPEWEYRFYSDNEMAGIVQATEQMTEEEFMKIPSGIERSDAFKAAALYMEGGIYCDVDIECFRPFDCLLKQLFADNPSSHCTELWLTPDHPIHCSRLFGYSAVKNHFIVAKPRSNFLGLYLRSLAEKSNLQQLGGDPVHSTGVAFLTSLLEKNGGAESSHVGLLASEWINPLPDLTLNFPEILPYRNLVAAGQWIQRLKPYVAHYWWHGYSQRSNMMDDLAESLFSNR